MKVFESDCTFDYPWREVSTANWVKYCPWNDKSTHVIAVDTLSRHIDGDSGILRTERLITCRQNAPKWVLALLGGQNTSHVHEVSYVDPAAQRVTLCSTNMSWTNVLSVRETVVYQPLPSAPDSRTQFKQDAKITALCGGWQKVKNCIEEATAERFDQNARAGREGFEHVLQISRRVFGEEREKQQLQQQREPPQRRRQHRQEHTA